MYLTEEQSAVFNKHFSLQWGSLEGSLGCCRLEGCFPGLFSVYVSAGLILVLISNPKAGNDGDVSTISGFYGSGAYLAWLLNNVSSLVKSKDVFYATATVALGDDEESSLWSGAKRSRRDPLRLLEVRRTPKLIVLAMRSGNLENLGSTEKNCPYFLITAMIQGPRLIAIVKSLRTNRNPWRTRTLKILEITSQQTFWIMRPTSNPQLNPNTVIGIWILYMRLDIV